jgi:peptidoglycan/LPS O-acetylase OafA/YrhL
MVVYRTAYYWWGSVGVERPNYGNLPFELIMVRTWGTRELDWNFPAWSIQAEWFAYIFVFPMTLLGMRMIENRWLIFVIPTLLLFLHGQLDFQAFPNLLGEIVLLFVGGCFLYRVRSELRRGPWVSWVATASVVFGILALLLSSKWSPSLLYLSFGVLILALSYDAGLLARLLGCRIMLYGGAISYSLYMTHWLVKIAFSFLVGKLDLGSYGESVVAAGGYVVSTLICAALFYHIVEKPAHRLLLKRGNVSS